MVTREDVLNVLKDVYDPEIPINIVDLGLIYGVEIHDGKVHVKMTLTSPGCPVSVFMTSNIRSKIESIEGVKEAEVEMVWDPPWGPEKMSEDAKKQLKIM